MILSPQSYDLQFLPELFELFVATVKIEMCF